MQPAAPGARSAAPGLVIALLAIYTLTAVGRFRVDDEHILAARSQSLALWGVLEEPQVWGNTRVQALLPMGDAATQIEPAQSVLGAIFYRIGMVYGAGTQAGFTISLYATALSAILILATIEGLGYVRRTAIWTALLFGLGSMAWSYASTYYRDPLAALMVAVAMYGLLRLHQGRRGSGVALIALGIAGGILSKNSVVPLVPAVLIGVAAGEARARRTARIFLVLGLLATVVLLSALLPTSGPLARFSLSYYLSLAQHFTGNLTPALAFSMLGPYVSPAKSIFIFSPSLLFMLALPWFWRRFPPGFLLAGLAFLLLLPLGQALFYGQAWAGAFGWGLRFMLPALPILAVLGAPAVGACLRGSGWVRQIPLGLLILGAVVQLGGVLVPWTIDLARWRSLGLDPFSPAAVWDPRFLAIPAQLVGLLRLDSWDPALLRVLRAGDRLAWIVIPLGVLLLFAGIRMASSSRWTWRARLLLFGGVIFPLLVATAFQAPDPAWGGDRPAYMGALSWVQSESTPGDRIVLDAYGTRLWSFWMNRLTQPARWYSLPYEIPSVSAEGQSPAVLPSPVALRVLGAASEGGGTLWYVLSAEAPDSSLGIKAAWLDAHAELAEIRRFEGPPDVVVRRYVLGP